MPALPYAHLCVLGMLSVGCTGHSFCCERSAAFLVIAAGEQSCHFVLLDHA